MSSQLSFVLNTLRDLDPERYAACLYLPQDKREDIATLWAFDAEVSRIPSLVSEPMPGEIRLQWWRDLIKSGNNVGAGPLAEALMDVVARHELPRETLHTYLEARIFDLYQDPMPDEGSFEGYLGETHSVFFQLAAMCSGDERSTNLANACGHAGMAFGIARLLCRCAVHRSKGQVFFPLDLLQKHELNREIWLSEEIFQEHLAVLDELERMALYHLTYARSVIGILPKESRSVFLTLSLVEPMLKLASRNRAQLLTQPISLSPLKRQWSLLRGAMRAIP